MRFIQPYRDIMLFPGFTPITKMVYTVIKSYTSSKGNMAWPTVAQIAWQVPCSEESVRLALDVLKAWRVLSWNSGSKGTANTYFLHDERAAALIKRGWAADTDVNATGRGFGRRNDIIEADAEAIEVLDSLPDTQTGHE